LELKGGIGWKNLRTEDYREKGPILLGVGNISKDGYLDMTNITRILEERYEESPEIKVRNGDVLLAKTGATIGKSCVVENLNEPATVNAAVNIFRIRKGCTSEYFRTLISSNYVQEIMFLNISHSAQGNLFQKEIKEIKCPIPDLKEQKLILE